jgi:transposase
VESARWSTRQAAAEVGVAQSTAKNWLYKDTHRRTGKHRLGRPPIITKSQLEAIDKWFTGYCKHWICSLTNIIKKFDLKCSPSTLCCALTKHGFHMQTPKMKEWLLLKVKAQRLAFAKLYKGKKKQFWRRDIYTDESTPNTRILRRLKLWQRKRDRHCLDCIQFKFHLGRKSFMA